MRKEAIGNIKAFVLLRFYAA